MLIANNYKFTCLADAPLKEGFEQLKEGNVLDLFLNLGFQEPASPLMDGLIGLHSDIWAIMIFIGGFIAYMMKQILSNSSEQSFKVHHNSLIEIIWTTLPALTICLMAVPSFSLLYCLDEIVEPALTVKATGNQWFWRYAYSDYASSADDTDFVGTSLAFDSNMLQDDDLSEGELRLLEVDNRLILPVNCHIRLLTSAGDVIHSFSVPSLGLKLDAIPGRLNQTMMFIKRQGVFYGQCSELCGTNHAMMPIVVEAVQEEDYIDWVNAKLQE